MALNINKCTFAGHLTRDPMVRQTGTGKNVANFSIAINNRFKTADGVLKEEVTFIDCAAWGRTAELIGQYLGKGSPVYVEGNMRQSAYEDKDGRKVKELKLIVREVQFVPTGKPMSAPAAGNGSPAASGDAAAAAPAEAPKGVVSSENDEPPF